jgi:hypothetical protein
LVRPSLDSGNRDPHAKQGIGASGFAFLVTTQQV